MRGQDWLMVSESMSILSGKEEQRGWDGGSVDWKLFRWWMGKQRTCRRLGQRGV